MGGSQRGHGIVRVAAAGWWWHRRWCGGGSGRGGGAPPAAAWWWQRLAMGQFFLISRLFFAECPTKDTRLTECSLPSATLDKPYAECNRAFAECS